MCEMAGQTCKTQESRSLELYFKGLEEAANQSFMAVKSIEMYYKPRMSAFNPSFPQSTSYSIF